MNMINMELFVETDKRTLVVHGEVLRLLTNWITPSILLSSETVNSYIIYIQHPKRFILIKNRWLLSNIYYYVCIATITNTCATYVWIIYNYMPTCCTKL